MRFITLQPPVDGAGAQWQLTGTNGCLKTLEVTPDTRADIALALSEACANVVQHAGPGEEYLVRVSTRDGQCAIEVVNAGSAAGQPAPDKLI